jgi:hypothetical protein
MKDFRNSLLFEQLSYSVGYLYSEVIVHSLSYF